MRRRLEQAYGPAMVALRTALADRDLRRLEVAWLTANAGKTAFLIVTLVIAYQAGGPVAVGILGLASYLPPTLVAPLAGVPTARWSPERVLAVLYGVRVSMVLVTLVIVALDAPIQWLYVAAAAEAAAGAFTRPLLLGLLPHVARTPEQLVAGNVASSAAEALGTFIGPAAAGILLATTGPTGALVGVLVTYALGVAAVARLRLPTVGRSGASIAAVRSQVLAGVVALRRFPAPRLIIMELGLQTFVRGLLTVLVVVAAFELLGMGEGGVGTLNAAMGLGGLFGAIAAIALAGRARLAPAFAGALAGWGAPIALIGIFVHPLVAILAMGLVGLSNALLDVAGFTLLQRTTPNASRMAMFGMLEMAASIGTSIGGIVAPVLIGWLGIDMALVATGAILPIAAVVGWPGLRHVDEGVVGTGRPAELLRAAPMFAPLSLATIEYLADSLVRVEYRDGDWLMREGDPGDHYCLIDRGEVEVSKSGRRLRTMGPGDAVGEIAVLRDVPRTASVRAAGPVEAYMLDRRDFLQAICGQATSLAAAAAVADRHLADRPADDAA
jgi:hypothetical protein